MNYFPIGKCIDHDYNMVDRVHDTGPWVHEALIKWQPLNPRWRAQIRSCEGVCESLISRVGSKMGGRH
jgi:hypothetical protein